MTILRELVDAIAQRRVEVVDLTAPLSEQTPILALPDEFGQTAPFSLAEISRYDDRGPAWYWNNSTTTVLVGTRSL
jgi:kynurenine formamidase